MLCGLSARQRSICVATSVAAACEADYDSSAVKRLKGALKEANTAIENLWKALEQGQAVDMITERIEKRTQEKDDLQTQLAIEMNKQIVFTAPQITSCLVGVWQLNFSRLVPFSLSFCFHGVTLLL